MTADFLNLDMYQTWYSAILRMPVSGKKACMMIIVNISRCYVVVHFVTLMRGSS